MSESSKSSEEPNEPEEVRLAKRLKDHPKLRQQIEEMLRIVENSDGRLEKAHEAEEQILKLVRQTGRTMLQAWAEREADKQARQVPKINPQAKRDKKKPLAGTLV